jgi:DNA modification methylase
MTVPYFKPNTIYCGDCKEVLANFPDECVDLIYLDPPFFSNKHYEVIWGDGYEIRAFEDRWKGGINHYIGWMEERVLQCYRVLKKTGSIYLHCDIHANHYLRMLMDKQFEMNNFRNEIYWYYYNKMHDSRKKMFPKATDTLLFYVKDEKSNYIFNQLVELRDKPVKQLKRKKVKGRMVNVKNAAGHVVYQIRDKRVIDNVWRISMLQPADRTQRFGYPTQKPEALLERVVTASSNPMDIVLDPFCGCGTAIAVSQKLGRQWVGIDVSPTACDLMERRMRSLSISPNVVGMPLSEADLRKIGDSDFQNWVVKRLFGRVSARKSGDMGIDGFTFEGDPIQVKQSDGVGRNVVDNFETAMRRRNARKGIIVAFGFGSGAYEEIARAKNQDGIEIIAITIKELIDSRKAQSSLSEHHK